MRGFFKKGSIGLEIFQSIRGVMDEGVTRVKFNGFFYPFFGFFEFSFEEVAGSQIIVSQSVFRIECDGFAKKDSSSGSFFLHATNPSDVSNDLTVFGVHLIGD
ncbi:MAG: hypothetical protein U1C97_01885, partial [Candidatus Gracilibacteria bacterium]|nr:hypothetical protein [Candidatus Gracilibacteria bacterium]